MRNNRPYIFIGSSTEGKDVAEALQENLDDDFEVGTWQQGTFGLSLSYIASIENAGENFDFAILVVTPDDEMTVRDEKVLKPRDNIIFELGYFIGVLGVQRTFIVRENVVNLKLPTDLNGINCAEYRRPQKGRLVEAVGKASNQIKRAITKAPYSKMFPSPNTPPDKLVKKLVDLTLALVCRALETPLDPDKAKLRAFIFKMKDSQLICSHFWSPRPTKEVVNDLKFDINEETSEHVVVVKAAQKKRVCAIHVEPLEEDIGGVYGEIEENLCFVLAAPILGPRGEVWGTVDIDASSKEGEELLSQELSHSLIFELGKYLYLTLSKEENVYDKMPANLLR